MDDLASSLQRAGFVDVGVVAKPESREFIKDWLPGSKAEDFVVAANVTAGAHTISIVVAPASFDDPAMHVAVSQLMVV